MGDEVRFATPEGARGPMVLLGHQCWGILGPALDPALDHLDGAGEDVGENGAAGGSEPGEGPPPASGGEGAQPEGGDAPAAAAAGDDATAKLRAKRKIAGDVIELIYRELESQRKREQELDRLAGRPAARLVDWTGPDEEPQPGQEQGQAEGGQDNPPGCPSQ